MNIGYRYLIGVLYALHASTEIFVSYWDLTLKYVHLSKFMSFATVAVFSNALQPFYWSLLIKSLRYLRSAMTRFY